MRLGRESAILWVVMTGAIACRRAPPPAPPIVDRPLPVVPAGELKYAGTPPTQPFAKQAGNHYLRTVFEADAPGDTHVEVRDVLIPPRSKSNLAALPGSAVMDLTTGKVMVSLTGKPEELAASAIRSLPAGQPIALENTEPRPAIVRLYIFRGR
jgi:hypothetical protein